MSVSFETNKLKSRRKAIIDGREYTVRRLGNIERLEIQRLNKESKDLVAKYLNDVKDEDIDTKDLDQLESNAERCSNIMVSLFDDGTEKQEYSRALVSSLEEDDIVDILEQVFGTKETAGNEGS